MRNKMNVKDQLRDIRERLNKLEVIQVYMTGNYSVNGYYKNVPIHKYIKDLDKKIDVALEYCKLEYTPETTKTVAAAVTKIKKEKK